MAAARNSAAAGRRRLSRVVGAALLAMTALVAATCSSGSAPAGLTTATTVIGVGATPEPGTPPAETVTIRLALAPDPVWQWLEDSGTVDIWEQEHNIRFEASNPFDQFAAFAGGHADVVLINALDVPKFVEQRERRPVIIGKYTRDRSILAVRRTSRAESLDDLVERTIAVESSLASTLLWGVIADARYGLDFRPDGADFDLVTVEPASIADLVIRGDVDACICSPDFSVPYLASGRLRPLYEGASAAELYSEGLLGDSARTPIADAFVVDKDWHVAHPDAIDAMLSLWDRGLEQWKLNKAQFVADYPHHFSVTTDEEIAWMTDYISDHDWVLRSAYISTEEAATQSAIFASLRELGLVPEGSIEPEIDLSYSSARDFLEGLLTGEGSEGDAGELDRLSERLSTPESGQDSGG